jgi:hypothetical protein
MEQMDKWNLKWNKLFQQVRIRWINEMSPEAFTFMKNIRFITSYVIKERNFKFFFKTTFNDKSDVIFSFTFFFDDEYTFNRVLLMSQCGNYHFYYYWNGITSRSLFINHDCFLIGEFLEKIIDEMEKEAQLIEQEKNSHSNNLFKEQIVGRTIVGYDEETKHFLLDNDEKINAESAFRFFKSIEEQKLFKEA